MKASTKTLLARAAKRLPIGPAGEAYLNLIAEGRIDWPKNKKTQRRRMRSKIARASRRR